MYKESDIPTFISSLFYISLITVSFDVFLVIPLGFNFRISQLALIPIFAYIAFKKILIPNIKLPIGFNYLLIWSLFIIAFIPNTSFLTRSIGYGFWHIFNLFLVLVTVQIFRNEKQIYRLLKIYIYSFAFVSLFGLVQFILPLFHLGSPLVMQWWFPGVLARINGFSYEPSYFATYLIIGWVLVAYLIKKNSSLLSRGAFVSVFTLITIVIVLSSSRMGIIMMMIWYIQYPSHFIGRLLLGQCNLKYLKVCLMLLIAASIPSILIFYIIGFDKLSFLLAGLGIAGTSSHSSGARLEGLTATLNAFMNSPFIGYSLGGVATAIGELYGIDITTLEDAKYSEGMNIFAEVLAASGIIGFFPFAIYLILLVYKPLKLASRMACCEMKNILIGMTCSLIYLIMILQMNQNILRPYIWLHISLLSSVFSVAKMFNKRKRTNDCTL